jgi:hypothetical protein
LGGLLGEAQFLLAAYAQERYPHARRPVQGYVFFEVEDEEELKITIEEGHKAAAEVCRAANAACEHVNRIGGLASKYLKAESRDARDQDTTTGHDAAAACEELTCLRYETERCLHVAYQNIAKLHCKVEEAFALVGVHYECPPHPCEDTFPPYSGEPRPVKDEADAASPRRRGRRGASESES